MKRPIARSPVERAASQPHGSSPLEPEVNSQTGHTVYGACSDLLNALGVEVSPEKQNQNSIEHQLEPRSDTPPLKKMHTELGNARPVCHKMVLNPWSSMTSNQSYADIRHNPPRASRREASKYYMTLDKKPEPVSQSKFYVDLNSPPSFSNNNNSDFPPLGAAPTKPKKTRSRKVMEVTPPAPRTPPTPPLFSPPTSPIRAPFSYAQAATSKKKVKVEKVKDEVQKKVEKKMQIGDSKRMLIGAGDSRHCVVAHVVEVHPEPLDKTDQMLDMFDRAKRGRITARNTSPIKDTVAKEVNGNSLSGQKELMKNKTTLDDDLEVLEWKEPPRTKDDESERGLTDEEARQICEDLRSLTFLPPDHDGYLLLSQKGGAPQWVKYGEARARILGEENLNYRDRKPAWAIETPSPVKEQPALSSIQEEQLEAGPSMEQKASASTPPESDASWGDDDAFGAFEL